MPQPMQAPMPKRRGTGSGFIVSADGYVLTNNHVIAGAEAVSIFLSAKEEVAATVVGADAKTDLAVLKIDRPNLKAAKLGDSDKLEVGEIVLAIGSPFGLDRTVTSGIVSAKGRANLRLADYENFIQTDAAINPGNSGGPLINLDGEVVGINTAIVSGSGASAGIGFAIPINMARRIMESLIEEGKVTRGFLGVRFQPLDKDLAEQYDLAESDGVIVTEVLGDSPASRAGLKTGDIIRKYDGVLIKDGNELRRRVAATPVGTTKEVAVWRDNKEVTLKVTLAELTQEAVYGKVVPPTQDLGFGLTLQVLTPELAEGFGHGPEVQGLVVTEVDAASQAAEKGLVPGDVIVEADRKPVRALNDFRSAAAALKGKKGLLLRIKSANGPARFVVLKDEPKAEK